MRRIHRRPKLEKEKLFRVNNQIKSEKVCLINDQGENLGSLSLSKALTMARESELDLVEVNPKVDPPIVKIMDYGQFKYERDKQAQKQKTKQKKTDTKVVRLSVRIGEHDLNFRLEQGKKFLSKGHKLKIELRLKGREKQHPEVARKTVEKFMENLKSNIDFELEIVEPLTKNGGQFTMLLANKGKNK